MSPFSCTFQVLGCVRKKSSLTTKPVTVRFIRLGYPAIKRGWIFFNVLHCLFCRTRKMMRQFSIKVRVRLTYECKHDFFQVLKFPRDDWSKYVNPTWTTGQPIFQHLIKKSESSGTASPAPPGFMMVPMFERCLASEKGRKTEEPLKLEEEEEQQQPPQQQEEEEGKRVCFTWPNHHWRKVSWDDFTDLLTVTKRKKISAKYDLNTFHDFIRLLAGSYVKS